MKLAVVKQGSPHEQRVPLTPPVVKKLTENRVEVLVESGAGIAAHQLDAAYEQAAARIERDPVDLWSQADAVITIEPPPIDRVKLMHRGAVLIGLLEPLNNLDATQQIAEKHLTAFSMEFLPRISRAQAMDVVSSQANIAGYKAVLLGANACTKIFPMLMTAAGTIAPSRVFVLGAGVAGLQAIATAKRLGAVVEAYDVRPEVAEQVESLGARFLKLSAARQEAPTDDGYAREQSEEDRRQQVQLMTKRLVASDVVLSTAAIFGKAPPILIPADVVSQMRPGTVIVDLAADVAVGHGNCAVTKPGTCYTTDHGVIIDGTLNLPSLVAVHASQCYANNIHQFLLQMLKDGELNIDLEDEILKGTLITHDGQIVNELVHEACETARGISA